MGDGTAQPFVLADPTYEPGRLLQADTFEQLGYQSESGPWRDSYLMGAMELRTGTKGFPMFVGRSITDQLDVDMLVELIGIRLQAENVEGESFESNWYFSDVDEHHRLGSTTVRSIIARGWRSRERRRSPARRRRWPRR